MGRASNEPPPSLGSARMRGRTRGAALSGTPDADPEAVAAAVESASAALLLALGRAEEAVLPRVSVSQLRALLIIDSHEKTNLSQLADELGAIPSSASRLCDRLVAAGLIRRRAGATDRREVELSPTAEGQRLIDELRECRRTELGRVLGSMSAEGRRALLVGLQEFQREADRAGDADHEVA
jgi:DNA-binding MarR family transcriptional regulator